MADDKEVFINLLGSVVKQVGTWELRSVVNGWAMEQAGRRYMAHRRREVSHTGLECESGSVCAWLE